MPKRNVVYMAARRDAILDAAASCLARTGSEGFSTTAICAEAGISMGALYTHFSGKENIIIALAQRFSEPKKNRFKATSAAEFRKRIFDVIDEIESESGALASRLELSILAIAATSPVALKEISKLNLRNSLLFTIETLQALGAVRPEIDAGVAATAIQSCLGGFTLARQTGQTDFAVHRRAMDLVLSNILVEKQGRRTVR